MYYLYLWFAFAFDILLHEHVLAIKDGIGKLPYPVAQDQHAGLATQRQVEFNVSVSVDKIVYVGMRLHVFVGKLHQIFLVLPKIRRLFAIGSLQTTVLCPG